MLKFLLSLHLRNTNKLLEIHKGIEGLSLEGCVVTVGMFDGVHKGHQQLLGELVSLARKKGLPSVVVTLWPHPKVVLSNGGDVRLLSTLSEKSEQIEQLGIDHLVILDFTQRLASLSPARFVRDILIGRLNARHFHIGFNHHFGAGKSTPEEEMKICENEGLPCTMGTQYVDETNGACSSSVIRGMLMAGDMEKVSLMLGRRYSVSGTVVHGDGIGHKIGFPTANLNLDESSKMLPGDGVYAAMANFDGLWRPAVVDIGMRPTVKGSEHRVEAHLINFSSKIYGRNMTISFFSRIREEKRFAMLEDLENQIVNDVEVAKSLLVI